MSRGAKQVLGVAAAIAIPYVAPIIATSIGASAALGAVGGSALVGAGLGAAQAGILGGDVARGALLGGVGGGVGGYIQQPAAATYNTATGDLFQAPTPTSYNAATGDAFNMAGQTAGPMSYDQVTGASYGQTGGVAPTVPTAGQPKSFAQAVSEVPGEIAGRFTDPRNLADMALRTGTYLAGSAIAGDGLTSEQRALVDAQMAELEQLQRVNPALFEQRLRESENLLSQGRYFDPEYFGLQSARRAQLAGATAKRAGLRGLEGERRGAEARRYDLGIARNVGTAYDTGYASAIGPRVQLTAAGLSAMPTSYPTSTSAFAPLMSTLNAGQTQARNTRQDIGRLFGSVAGLEEPRTRTQDQTDDLNRRSVI